MYGYASFVLSPFSRCGYAGISYRREVPCNIRCVTQLGQLRVTKGKLSLDETIQDRKGNIMMLLCTTVHETKTSK